MKVGALVSAIVFGMLSAIVVVVIAQLNYMKSHHCWTTGNSKTEWKYMPQSYDGGKTMQAVLTPVFLYQYQCDDGEHWF